MKSMNDKKAIKTDNADSGLTLFRLIESISPETMVDVWEPGMSLVYFPDYSYPSNFCKNILKFCGDCKYLSQELLDAKVVEWTTDKNGNIKVSINL